MHDKLLEKREIVEMGWKVAVHDRYRGKKHSNNKGFIEAQHSNEPMVEQAADE